MQGDVKGHATLLLLLFLISGNSTFAQDVNNCTLTVRNKDGKSAVDNIHLVKNLVCNVAYPEKLGDGTCDGGDYNTQACSYDEGDCAEFNNLYPDCDITSPSNVGNGYCDGGDYNREECGCDGMDCCSADNLDLLGDGTCHGGVYNTLQCAYDKGDCTVFNGFFPDCNVEFPGNIGNNYCDAGEYNTAACGFDGGDCMAFNVWKNMGI